MPNPIEVPKYVVVNEMDDEPALYLCVRDILKNVNPTISKVKSKYWRTTHNFGIHKTKTADEALKIDRKMEIWTGMMR